MKQARYALFVFALGYGLSTDVRISNLKPGGLHLGMSEAHAQSNPLPALAKQWLDAQRNKRNRRR